MSLFTVNVGLAVGLSVAIVFMIILIGVPICVVVAVYSSNRRRLVTRTRLVATTPATGTTVVTSAGNTSFSAAPTAYPAQPNPGFYPSQPPPAPYSTYPPQASYPGQPQEKHGEAPPSYDAAIMYPPQVAILTSNGYSRTSDKAHSQ